MYEGLESNGPLPLQWNWPHGKRAPSDNSSFIEEDDEEEAETKYVADIDFITQLSSPFEGYCFNYSFIVSQS